MGDGGGDGDGDGGSGGSGGGGSRAASADCGETGASAIGSERAGAAAGYAEGGGNATAPAEGGISIALSSRISIACAPSALLRLAASYAVRDVTCGAEPIGNAAPAEMQAASSHRRMGRLRQRRTPCLARWCVRLFRSEDISVWDEARIEARPNRPWALYFSYFRVRAIGRRSPRSLCRRSSFLKLTCHTLNGAGAVWVCGFMFKHFHTYGAVNDSDSLGLWRITRRLAHQCRPATCRCRHATRRDGETSRPRPEALHRRTTMNTTSCRPHQRACRHLQGPRAVLQTRHGQQRHPCPSCVSTTTLV